MYQIDVPSASPTLPAASAPGIAGYFTDGSIAGGVDPTVVPAEFLNALMLELLGVVAAGGLAPAKGANGQVLLAIQNLIEARSGNYALDTGTAVAFVVALSPPIAAYPNGLQVRFRATHANAGACTLDAGGGAIALLRDDGAALQQGDIPLNSIVSATYDKPANAFLLNSVVLSQFGALAKLNLGAFLKVDGAGNLTLRNGAFLADDGSGNLAVPIADGLEADGSGKLRVKLADSSLRRSNAGLQANEPVTYFSGAASVAAAGHMGCFVSTAASTLTVPATAATWNGFGFSVSAVTGTVTILPAAADKINNGVAGASYLVPNGTSAFFVSDGAGNIDVLFQTAVPGASPAAQYINFTQSISSGQYNVDTSLGVVQLTLPASPPQGTPIVFNDAFGTWPSANVILIPGGGGNTINGSPAPFALDVTQRDVSIIYKNGNWSFQ
jgi:hypothetical protein